MNSLSLWLRSFISPQALSFGYLLGFIFCGSLLGAAYYYEYAQYLDPCPLCIVQRIVVLMIGLGCLLAFFLRHASWGLWLTVLWVVAWSLFGWWVTDHHLWIQNLPADQVPSCGPDLAYMVQTLPLGELISTMLRGNGSCAEVSWTFLSFSMPWWMRAVSIGFVIVSVVGLIRTWPKTASSAV